jgi:hypothetical protein
MSIGKIISKLGNENHLSPCFKKSMLLSGMFYQLVTQSIPKNESGFTLSHTKFFLAASVSFWPFPVIQITKIHAR